MMVSKFSEKLGQWSKYGFYLIFPFLSFNLYGQEKVLRFDHLTVEDGLSQNTVMGIVKDKYGFMWFGTFEGLCRYDGYKFTRYHSDQNNPHSLWNNRISLLYKDTRGTLWIATADTLICRYNYETDDFTRFRWRYVPKDIVDSLDRSKSIYFTRIIRKDFDWQVNQSNSRLTLMYPFNKISNLNMLVQTDKRTGRKLIYRNNPFNRWTISDESVFNIYLDDNNILWVGTYSGGVNKADIRQKPFMLYSQDPMSPDKSIIDNKIRAIYDDNHGNLWIGTHNRGITRIDMKTNTYTHFIHNPKDTINSLIENEVRKIYGDRFGYIWFGTKGGLERFDPKTSRIKHYTITTKSRVPHNWVYSIMEDHAGYLWIGTWNGIAKYDRKNDRFLAYDPKQTLKRSNVRVVLEDHAYNLWVATEGGGITKFQRDSSAGFNEKLIPKHYVHSNSDSNSLSSDRVYTMLEDENGIMWIGTNSGLNSFNPKTGKFRRFFIEDGLPDELIVGLLSDRKGHLWISHKKGLSRLDTKTFTIRNYDREDGLQDNEFSEDAYFRNAKTGEMFFGGVKGFNSFYPDSMHDNKYLPKIVFTNLQINNKTVAINESVNGRIILSKPIFLTREITIGHNEKSITVGFAALHYANPYKNQYLYKLNGFDKEWIATDSRNRIASYSNLPDGQYVLQVKASNNDGVWNPQPIELTINVHPPWWGTWWFKISMIIAAALLFYLLMHLRMSIYRKTQKELTKLVRDRTQKLEETNELLLERQTRIEEQSEELRAHSEGLKEANDLLVQRQNLIKLQAEKLLETNEELVKLNSTKDRFFSIIAHDLRNPFHIVTGFTELLLRDYEKMPFDKVNKYLNLMYNSSRSGNNLLENLLQWSRTQTGTISYEPVHLNLFTIAKETFDYLEGDAHKKSIEVRLNIDRHLTVVADENMLKTILRNLLSNAIKFTYENGKIAVNTSMDGNMVEISITDTGVGIPVDKFPLLFKIETNISTRGTSQETGTGLGLILCKEFVEKHKGMIWVESKENEGTTFRFTLPIYQ